MQFHESKKKRITTSERNNKKKKNMKNHFFYVPNLMFAYARKEFQNHNTITKN